MGCDADCTYEPIRNASRVASNIRYMEQIGIDSKSILIIGDRPDFRKHALDSWGVSDISQIPEDGRTYDLIYCSHQMEHFASVKDGMALLKRHLSPEGSIFIEVPNVEAISHCVMIEEFFVDAHCFHFSSGSLNCAASSASLKIDRIEISPLHITAILKHGVSPLPPVDAKAPVLMVNEYSKSLQSNRRKLPAISQKIKFLASRNRVAFWGAGRQLDAFVKYGAFDLSSVKCVVDSYLHSMEHLGVRVSHPIELKSQSLHIVIVFANSGFNEIAEKVHSYGIPHAIRFIDLL